jgi:hypothetical protein
MGTHNRLENSRSARVALCVNPTRTDTACLLIMLSTLQAAHTMSLILLDLQYLQTSLCSRSTPNSSHMFVIVVHLIALRVVAVVAIYEDNTHHPLIHPLQVNLRSRQRIVKRKTNSLGRTVISCHNFLR